MDFPSGAILMRVAVSGTRRTHTTIFRSQPPSRTQIGPKNKVSLSMTGSCINYGTQLQVGADVVTVDEWVNDSIIDPKSRWNRGNTVALFERGNRASREKVFDDIRGDRLNFYGA